MTKNLTIAACIAITLFLSACDKAAELPQAQASSDRNGDMAMLVEAKSGKGVGTVTAIDAAAGKITLDHQAIPSVGWPAMTMGFSAKSDILNNVAVGDKVEFDISVNGNAATVTAMRKQ